MRYIVTGGAGFIGSVISRQLLSAGKTVAIIDKLDSLLYSAEIKQSRLDSLRSSFKFDYYPIDLAKDNLAGILREDDIVIHSAALPGQVLSWKSFEEYSNSNILATMRLLEESVESGVRNFVYSSTSSVYGKVASSDLNRKLEPHSPYGVTKLAGENLVKCYHANFGLNVKILRYFSVYGPGQRSDLAIQIFLESILAGEEITISGDGKQSRDFTFVEDCASATISAADSDHSLLISDVAGGQIATINEILELCFEITGKRVPVLYADKVKGDQDRTLGSPLSSELSFGAVKSRDLHAGITAQWKYIVSRERSE